jgi:hypothetical protein
MAELTGGFCSNPCKYDYHTLKRVKALLKGLHNMKRKSKPTISPVGLIDGGQSLSGF